MIKTVNVTDQDLRKGIANSCIACPVARALLRVVHENTVVKVNLLTVSFLKPGLPTRKIMLPMDVKYFIAAVDRFNRNIQPICFSLDIPDEFLEDYGTKA